jgi:hypothetical protein
MAVIIQDGLGKGFTARVDSEGRMHTVAHTNPTDFHTNNDFGKVWSLPFGPRDPTGVGDYVFYLKNTGSNNIAVTDIRLSCTGAASQVSIDAVTGTAAAGTTIVPVARNLGSTASPVAIAEDSVNITGITTAGTLFYMEMPTVSTLYHLKTTSNIILPKSSAIGISVAVATSIVTGMVSIVELV